MLGHTWTRYVLLLIACTWPAVQANTEIVNIQAVRSVAGGHQPPSAWPLFSAASRQQSFELEPIPLNFRPEDACTAGATHCPYDLWAILNFDDPVWVRSSKFTFRLSWPANYPVDCLIDVFPPTNLPPSLGFLPSPGDEDGDASVVTRRQYARIRLIDTGIHPSPWMHVKAQPVPLTVILEPLLFGALPASVAPVLGFLLPIVLAAWFVMAPRAHRYMSAVAEGIRKEKLTSKLE